MEQLKIIRKELGKNQKEIAELFGISQSAWSSYEKGAKPLSKRVRYMLEKEYNINPEFLDGKTEEIYKSEKTDKNTDTQLIQQTIELYNKLSLPNKELIKN